MGSEIVAGQVVTLFRENSGAILRRGEELTLDLKAHPVRFMPRNR